MSGRLGGRAAWRPGRDHDGEAALALSDSITCFATTKPLAARCNRSRTGVGAGDARSGISSLLLLLLLLLLLARWVLSPSRRASGAARARSRSCLAVLNTTLLPPLPQATAGEGSDAVCTNNPCSSSDDISSSSPSLYTTTYCALLPPDDATRSTRPDLTARPSPPRTGLQTAMPTSLDCWWLSGPPRSAAVHFKSSRGGECAAASAAGVAW